MQDSIPHARVQNENKINKTPTLMEFTSGGGWQIINKEYMINIDKYNPVKKYSNSQESNSNE